MSRADVLGGPIAGAAALGVGGLALPAFAAEEAATAAPTDLGPAPSNFALSKEYYKDAAQMLQHMRCVEFACSWVLGLVWLVNAGGCGRARLLGWMTTPSQGPPTYVILTHACMHLCAGTRPS